MRPLERDSDWDSFCSWFDTDNNSLALYRVREQPSCRHKQVDDDSANHPAPGHRQRDAGIGRARLVLDFVHHRVSLIGDYSSASVTQ